MGDRVSIQFKDGQGNLSAVLGDHWNGMDVVEAARAWLLKWKADHPLKGNVPTPETRLEADCLMLHFIRETLYGDRIVATENDYDNSDNGHHILETDSPPGAFQW